MQALARKARIGLFGAVDSVPQEGMADGGQVDPDLVGAAGLQAALEMGIAGKTFQDRPVGDRLPATQAVHGHLLAVAVMPPDGGAYGARVLLKAAHRHRLVLPVEGVVLKLPGQGQVGEVALGGDDKAGGVPVDAVDDARAQFPVDS